MKNHYVIKISGKVQGVFFRARTKDKATELGINGFVRNENDGSVYVECEGDETILKEFIAWCHHGPERARVDKVEVVEGALKDFVGFLVER